ncbi:MAG: hypothetical protein ACUVRV_00945 [Cyanobacteriota bacterium]
MAHSFIGGQWEHTAMVQSYSVCFDRAASFYDVTRGFPAGVDEEIADAILSAVEATQNTYFLEVGIGTGRLSLDPSRLCLFRH